jgi:hypothetical protein
MGPSLRSRIQKTENAVGAPWLTPSEEIQEGAISRDDFNFLGDSQGIIMIEQGHTMNMQTN